MHPATTITTRAQRHDVRGAETLAAKAAMRRGGAGKRRLNRSPSEAALFTVLRHLRHKTTWFESTLIQADPARRRGPDP